MSETFMRTRSIFTYSILAILFIPLVYAESLEIKVTKVAKHFYALDGKPILIQSENCDETGDDRIAFLELNGDKKALIFREPEGKCDVRSAYKLSSGGLGSYGVSIRFDVENWYAIETTNSFIFTERCLGFDKVKSATLSLNAGGLGTLFIDQSECLVKGIYTKYE